MLTNICHHNLIRLRSRKPNAIISRSRCVRMNASRKGLRNVHTANFAWRRAISQSRIANIFQEIVKTRIDNGHNDRHVIVHIVAAALPPASSTADAGIQRWRHRRRIPEAKIRSSHVRCIRVSRLMFHCWLLSSLLVVVVG